MASLRSLARPLRRAAAAAAAPAPGSRAYASLLLAEHDGKALSKATLQTAAAAAQLPGASRLDVLVLGKGCGDVAKECSEIAGVGKVLVAESEQFRPPGRGHDRGVVAGVAEA